MEFTGHSLVGFDGLNGLTLNTIDDLGEAVRDVTFLILFNSYHEGVKFVMPESPGRLG